MVKMSNDFAFIPIGIHRIPNQQHLIFHLSTNTSGFKHVLFLPLLVFFNWVENTT